LSIYLADAAKVININCSTILISFGPKGQEDRVLRVVKTLLARFHNFQ